MSYKSNKKSDDSGFEDFDLILTPLQTAAFKAMMLKFDNDPHQYCNRYKFNTQNRELGFMTQPETNIPTETSVANFLHITKLQGYEWADFNIKDWIILRKFKSPFEVIRNLCLKMDLKPLDIVWDEESRAENARRFAHIGELLKKPKAV